MPRELICVQVGQCGNQLGGRFWDLAVQEHMQYSKGQFDDSMTSFFRNTDQRSGMEIPCAGGKGPVQQLKARAVNIDMEEGPLASIMRGPLSNLFDPGHFISDVGGCGNNWAVGFCDYGPKYRDDILNSVRQQAEHCDSLQTFLLTHSLGGGTGSGLGTYVLNLLEDEFPHVYRFCCSVFPSKDDDVITSPYNSVLSIHQLISHADCVLPIDNQSLSDISTRALQSCGKPGGEHGASTPKDQLFNIAETNSKAYKKGMAKGGQAYDAMNNIAANMLCNLTSSMRFPGLLNIDLNEITTNLVPFPKLHFLIPATTPIALGKKDSALGPKRVDQMFQDATEKDFQLIRCDPRRHRYLACAFLVRGGDVTIADVNRNVSRLQSRLDMIHWNREGFKLGLCSASPLGQPYSLLSLSNNTCFGGVLQGMSDRCMKMYSVGANLYHYTEYISQEIFDDALENIACSIDDYNILASAEPPRATHPSQRYKSVI
eukprot:NODE_1628_length_1657_cov_114.443937_g1549_i0.p1 GENE.NODE_1628_length_1657_cov_114.443937_g1549_i0~~NODE_1628_length_1657_cov_114.443937_g1549_i0.p1  ORF type:complete len:486 (-),score=68.65 NODE_1628_length_1657_cov_114.443937_g1549_i0:105-1562(-)